MYMGCKNKQAKPQVWSLGDKERRKRAGEVERTSRGGLRRQLKGIAGCLEYLGEPWGIFRSASDHNWERWVRRAMQVGSSGKQLTGRFSGKKEGRSTGICELDRQGHQRHY